MVSVPIFDRNLMDKPIKRELLYPEFHDSSDPPWKPFYASGIEKYGVLHLPSKLRANMTLNAALVEPLQIQTDNETLELEHAHKAMCEMTAEYQCSETVARGNMSMDSGDIYPMCQIQVPASAEWLKSHYEEHDGISLPRSVVYSHYLDFCVRYNFEPANPAGFGKMIRTVFPRIKTRRLGNRGNSKYHYYGIKIKEQSPYRDIMSLTQRVNNISCLASSGVHSRTVVSETQASADGVRTTDVTIGHTSITIPAFPTMQNVQCPTDLLDLVAVLLQLYKSFCQRLIDSLVRADFQQVQSLLLNFWKSIPEHMERCMRRRFACEVLTLCDMAMYTVAENLLVPSIIQALPLSLLQDIQQFSKDLVKWTTDALGSDNPMLADLKIQAVKSFSAILQKRSELNHEISFTQNILHSYDRVVTMRVDWAKLDFDSIVCRCIWVTGLQAARDSKRILKYLNEFGNMLDQLMTIDKYFAWLRSLVERFVKKVASKSTFCYRRIAQDFILKWNMASNCVLKELFLDGATSYGCFQLVHLTMRDYVMLQIQKYEADLTEMSLRQQVCNDKTPIRHYQDNFGHHSCSLSDDETPHCSDCVQDDPIDLMGSNVDESQIGDLDDFQECFHDTMNDVYQWQNQECSIVSPIIKLEPLDTDLCPEFPLESSDLDCDVDQVEPRSTNAKHRQSDSFIYSVKHELSHC